MTFDQITIVGIATIAISSCIKFIGFPKQAIKIYKSKSNANVSALLFCFSFVSYILWTYYGYLKNDRVIMVGQGVGILTSGIVLYLIYKNKKTSIKKSDCRKTNI